MAPWHAYGAADLVGKGIRPDEDFSRRMVHRIVYQPLDAASAWQEDDRSRRARLWIEVAVRHLRGARWLSLGCGRPMAGALRISGRRPCGSAWQHGGSIEGRTRGSGRQGRRSSMRPPPLACCVIGLEARQR